MCSKLLWKSYQLLMFLFFSFLSFSFTKNQTYKQIIKHVIVMPLEVRQQFVNKQLEIVFVNLDFQVEIVHNVFLEDMVLIVFVSFFSFISFFISSNFGFISIKWIKKLPKECQNCEHGTCNDGISGSGDCNCNNGWDSTLTGKKCDKCSSLRYGPDCSGILFLLIPFFLFLFLFLLKKILK